MDLTPGRRRGIELAVWALAACVCAGALLMGRAAAEVEDDGRLLLWAAAGALGCAGAGLALLACGQRDAFVWTVEGSGLRGRWTLSGPTARLPLEGAVSLETRVVTTENDDFEVACAVFHSPRFGKVELWREPLGEPATSREAWGRLELRGSEEGAHEFPRDAGDHVIASGWTWAQRGAVAAGPGVLLAPVTLLAMLEVPVTARVLALALPLVVAGAVLARTLAVVDIKRTVQGFAYRRRLGALPLSPWRQAPPPATLDLTRYPSIEWRGADGVRLLRVRGGPRGLSPAAALRLTAALRDPAQRSSRIA